MGTKTPAVFIVIVVLGFSALVYAVFTKQDRVIQPIAFNHTVHILDAHIECIQCHTDAETSVYAGLPGKEMCYECHDIDDEAGSHVEKDKLFGFDELETDIPWRRIALTRPDVFFSHRRHVKSAGLDCLQCHSDQESLTKPLPYARIVMSMDDCIACHEQNNTSNDCLNCHR